MCIIFILFFLIVLIFEGFKKFFLFGRRWKENVDFYENVLLILLFVLLFDFLVGVEDLFISLI